MLRADAYVIEGILTALGQLEVELTIDDVPADRAQFGLGESAPRIEIAPQSGDPIRLALGTDAPVGAVRYVESSTRPGVILAVTSSMLGELEPDLEKLRDKSVIPLEPRQVQQVQVEVGGKPLVTVQRHPGSQETLEKAGSEDIAVEKAGDWDLAQPLAEKADGDRIFRYLQDLHFARAESFVDDPGKPAEYGLEKPDARVRLIPAGDGTVELAIGRKDDKVYARVDGTGPVLKVPARVLDGLPRQLFDYRNKRVFEVNAPDVERIELEFPRDTQAVAFKRDGEKWLPESSEWKVQDFRVGDLLYELDRVDATGLEEGTPDLARLGLEPPAVRVSVYGKDKAPIGWLALGNASQGQGTPARSSSSDRTWRVVKDIGEKIPLGLDAFRSSWLVPDTPPASEPAAVTSDAVPAPAAAPAAQ